jgi:anti-anti-sigma factor
MSDYPADPLREVGMPFEIRALGDAAVVTLFHECTPEELADARESLVPLLASETRHVLIDAADVRHVESSLVGRLLAIRKTVTDHGGRTSLIRPSPILGKVLDALGILDLFAVDASEEEALRRIRSESSPS